MAPNNTTTKMSVDFDLTDIEDIDAISDEFVDADPSSDDDTFISNKNKKITKKRQKSAFKNGIIVSKNIINNNNGELKFDEKNIEKYETVIMTSSDRDAAGPLSNGKDIQATSATTKFDDSEDEEEKLVAEKKKNGVRSPHILSLNGPTDHFNELEKKMNGPGWMITSSSATQSEDELGAFERDEFAFKMCQIIRRSGREKQQHRTKKHAHHQSKHEKIVVRHPSEDATTTKIEISTTTTEVQEEEEDDSDSSDGGNMLKYCSKDVPLADLDEDDL